MRIAMRLFMSKISTTAFAICFCAALVLALFEMKLVRKMSLHDLYDNVESNTIYRNGEGGSH